MCSIIQQMLIPTANAIHTDWFLYFKILPILCNRDRFVTCLSRTGNRNIRGGDKISLDADCSRNQERLVRYSEISDIHFYKYTSYCSWNHTAGSYCGFWKQLKLHSYSEYNRPLNYPHLQTLLLYSTFYVLYHQTRTIV